MYFWEPVYDWLPLITRPQTFAISDHNCTCHQVQQNWIYKEDISAKEVMMGNWKREWFSGNRRICVDYRRHQTNLAAQLL
mmetsp:Transcript_39525/g.61163  ORF Transcript_39525/g.61163 Transcript_39525/m.61163 type:complete len:80 (+) Transcript_39525:162-401(+)